MGGCRDVEWTGGDGLDKIEDGTGGGILCGTADCDADHPCDLRLLLLLRR